VGAPGAPDRFLRFERSDHGERERERDLRTSYRRISCIYPYIHMNNNKKSPLIIKYVIPYTMCGCSGAPGERFLRFERSDHGERERCHLFL
jgi:hypothetical protein